MKSNSCCVFTENQFQLVLPPLLVLEFVVGVLGNSLALWIFSFHMKPWKSSTVLLFNLALADFLLTVPLPFRAAYYQRGRDWMYGDAFCRVCIFMLAMNRGGSILFMMAVAVDRYLRVVLPHHPLNSMSVFKAMGVAGAIWALAISLTAHLLFWSHLHQANNKTQCDSFIICNNTNFSYYWHKCVFIISFYIPLGVILYCSICIISQLRDRQLDKNTKIRKALRCIAVVVVVFFICFFPSNLTEMMILTKSIHHNIACENFKSLEMAFYFTISFTYLNSMLDPMIYYFSSPTFRKMYRQLLMRCLRRKAKSDAKEDQTHDTGSQTISQL